MIGMEMVGISKKYWILLAASVLAFSCAKEMEVGVSEPMRGDYDPVVRFGLETYVGADPVTKTTYAGEDQTYILNSVRYERINWNVKEPTSPTDPPVDVVQIKSEKDFTKRAGQNTADYKAVEISGHTNQTGNKDDEADTAPTSGDAKDNFYWSAEKEDRYFYAVYPSPNVTGATLANFSIDASHTATVEGEMPAIQPHYISVKVNGTPATPGSPASIEYMPDMTNAYMYAAAKMPGADAGYKKVPLRFKPLFSAVKLHVTARDAGMQKYRLKKVELRTDLHYNDAYLRLNPSSSGTALGGKFKAKFKVDGSGSTEDFTLVGNPSDTCKRLTINILEGDRKVLNEDTLKLTFLALPIDQKYMTVDYTFECLVDDSLDPNNPANWPAEGTADRDKKVKTIRRFLTLQDRNKIFKDEGWYTLQKARKLYVRSGVPEIEYFFDVQVQAHFPRTWQSGEPMVSGSATHYLAEDFWSVKSYRDSSGIKQPLKWEITGYKAEGASDYTIGGCPVWLYLEKDKDDGTPVDPSDDKKLLGDYSFVSYDAGAPNNGDPSSNVWAVPVSYLCRDLNGDYKYPAFEPDGSVTDILKAGEAYAYDLSSHDIYGNLYDYLTMNGELGTTANCYVVSAPGWYRFPAVYGNAIKDGLENQDAFNSTGGTNLLDAFKNHKNEDIVDPWIYNNSIDIDDVVVVWEDAVGLISTDSVTKPFYHDGYVYFHVSQLASANAVIAVKSGGDIVWSWHIWGVVDPVNTLRTVQIQRTLRRYGSTQPFQYQSSHGDSEFFKEMDLGQHSYESTTVPPRYCDVRFEQKYKDKTIKTIVRRFMQSGVEDIPSYQLTTGGTMNGITYSAVYANALTYQWGRKDPFRGDVERVKYADATENNLGEAIMHPDVMYRAPSNKSWSGTMRVDNLWNSNVDYYPTSFAGFDLNGIGNGYRRDTYVTKTIYDPCPPGFCVPNLFAFTAFNCRGLLETKAPVGEYAKNAATTWWSGGKYYDFYTGNSDTAIERRDKNSETIRFYARGRRAAGNISDQQTQFNQITATSNEQYGHYWLAEPASVGANWSYGSSFMFSHPSTSEGKPTNTTSLNTMIYPVSGANGSPKWQRTHGLYIRPMKEQ